MHWVDKLTIEYEEGKKDLARQLRKLGNSEQDRSDRSNINSMIADMEFDLEWMKTGREPDTYRGAEKNGIYQRNSMADMDMFPSLEITPTERSLTEDEKIQVYDKLAKLSVRQRQTFIMSEAYLWKQDKIAGELGISRQAVTKYIKQAKDKLKEE